MNSEAPPPPPEDPSRGSSRSMWQVASRFSYVGIFFGVAVVVGWLAGSWLERRYGGAPWVSLAGVLFGVASGFRELFRIARAASAMERGRE